MRHYYAILFYLFVKTLSNICIHISNHHSNYVVKTQIGVIVSNVLFLFSLTFLSRIFVNSISECPKTSISNPVISSNNNSKIINSCSHTTETEVVVWKCVFFRRKSKKRSPQRRHSVQCLLLGHRTDKIQQKPQQKSLTAFSTRAATVVNPATTKKKLRVWHWPRMSTPVWGGKRAVSARNRNRNQRRSERGCSELSDRAFQEPRRMHISLLSLLFEVRIVTFLAASNANTTTNLGLS